ncbi:MAG: IS21-like element helper ATPase IstB [Spirochaetes bacterium]|nr:IS21-like element helper ATPase IstB [Spirochaetota bacterium]
MTNESTLEKMNAMKMYGMANAFKSITKTNGAQNYTNDEIIGHLVDAEWDDRYNKKLERLLKSAKFRYESYVEKLDYSKTRNLDKKLVLNLTECNWIKRGENIIITGATGVGKSYLSCALGHCACLKGLRVQYFNSMKLFGMLKYSKADGSYFREIQKIARQDLIILDDFGLKILDNDSRLIMLEILEDRYGKKSIIVSTQLPIDKWHDVIGDKTIADAICDRIVHNSHYIDLKGGSLRRKEKIALEN